MLMHDYGGGRGELDLRWHKQISLFTKWNSFQISPVVLLKLIMFFISGFSLIYIYFVNLNSQDNIFFFN